MKMTTEQVWDFIIQNNIATEEECQLVTKINGYTIEKLNDIIEVRTEYHSVDQIHDCEPESYDFSMVDLEEDSDDDYEPEDDDGWDAYVMSNAYGPDDC
jgi:hypothetical protein